MKLRDVMTQHVQEITPSATLQEAAEQMRDLDVGVLPVCQNDQLLGMITDRDITVRSAAQGQNPQQWQVQDAMTRELVYCYDDEDVEVAVDLMEERKIRRLPVLDRSKRIVGIVSLGDLAIRQGGEKLTGEILHQVSQPTQPHA